MNKLIQKTGLRKIDDPYKTYNSARSDDVHKALILQFF